MDTANPILQDPTLPLAADALRALHVPGDPLVLVNVWDVASAAEVAAAGARAIGTSSAAVAASLGEADDDSMPLAAAFGAIERIAGSVAVPVTADVEAGYGLDGTELVGALLAAGAVGCNLEDSDHRHPGELVDVGVAAGRIASVRTAAEAAGVALVVNARIDVLRHRDDRPAGLSEVVRRARVYAEAGADCVFPIGVSDPATAAHLVEAVDVAVNVGLGPDVTVAQMASVGVSRISFGPTFHRRAMADLRRRAVELLTPAPG